MATDLDVASLAAQFEALSTRRMLARAWELFGADEIAISFSGAEDVLLIELACDALQPLKPRVFSLDTGRLHPETYRFFARVEHHCARHRRWAPVADHPTCQVDCGVPRAAVLYRLAIAHVPCVHQRPLRIEPIGTSS